MLASVQEPTDLNMYNKSVASVVTLELKNDTEIDRAGDILFFFTSLSCIDYLFLIYSVYMVLYNVYGLG